MADPNIALYVPGRHDWHSVTPEKVLDLPASHETHGSYPVAEYCPAPHFALDGLKHSTAPDADVILPPGQGVHEDAPNTFEYVFTSHNCGADMPAAPAKVPGLQGVHVELPRIYEYDPYCRR